VGRVESGLEVASVGAIGPVRSAPDGPVKDVGGLETVAPALGGVATTGGLTVGPIPSVDCGAGPTVGTVLSGCPTVATGGEVSRETVTGVFSGAAVPESATGVPTATGGEVTSTAGGGAVAGGGVGSSALAESGARQSVRKTLAARKRAAFIPIMPPVRRKYSLEYTSLPAQAVESTGAWRSSQD
jgi:hypothetical protein